MNGYIKLFRQFLEWEWYDDVNTKTVFLHCILKANFKSKKWRGKTIKRGQFYTSLGHLSTECGVSVRGVRTALEKLEKTGEIKREATKTYTIITICKFESYQCNKENDRQTTDKEATNDRQTTDKRPTTTEERKKDKKDKKESKYIYLAEFEKIKKGDLPQKSQLDKNFHFGLFEENWSDEFKNAILEMWRYLESKEYRPERWGNVGTLKSQLDVIRSSLNEYSEKEIIEGFKACRFASKKSWYLYIKKKELNDISDYTPSYKLPNFKDENQRLYYFIARFEEYRKHVSDADRPTANTKLKKRAIYQKEAEAVCYELEQKYPQFAELDINWN